MSNNFLSPRKVLRRFRYLPIVLKSTKNWMTFMRNYAFGKTDGTYLFRNGGKLKIHSGFDHVPIIEVMMKKDYGQIRDNITIIDIGASTGVFSVYACSTAKNLSIYAFEPSLDYFNTLKENIQINNLQSSVRCFNKAVAGANEVRNITLRSETFIYPSLKGESKNANSQTIECVTLEKILRDNGIEKVGLLKMDCEGAEYEIFKNTATEVLKKVEEIRMEYHNIGSNENVKELRSLLLEKGFKETHFSETTNVFGNIWFKRV